MADSTASRSFADLRPRIVSGVVMGLVALAALSFGGIWSAALIAAAAGVMGWEWREMSLPGAKAGEIAIAVAGPALGVLGVHFGGFLLGLPLLVLGVGALAAMDYAEGRKIRWTIGGGLYIGIAAAAFIALRDTQPFGFEVALWVVLVVMGADIGGYFAGRIVGGPKLWPQVSPKKTWAGLFGGIALAFIIGGLFSWGTTGTYAEEVCVVSAIAALVAQAGDIGESALKRHFGVKDSGALIPGHGGALDRLDGLMAATLVAAFITLVRGQPVFVW